MDDAAARISKRAEIGSRKRCRIHQYRTRTSGGIQVDTVRLDDVWTLAGDIDQRPVEAGRSVATASHCAQRHCTRSALNVGPIQISVAHLLVDAREFPAASDHAKRGIGELRRL